MRQENMHLSEEWSSVHNGVFTVQGRVLFGRVFVWSTFGFEIEISDWLWYSISYKNLSRLFYCNFHHSLLFWIYLAFLSEEWSSVHNGGLQCKGVYCLNVQADSSDSKDIDADDDAAD